MPTPYRRVNLAVKPLIDEILEELSGYSGQSKAAIVMEAVGAYLPALRKRIRDHEAANGIEREVHGSGVPIRGRGESDPLDKQPLPKARPVGPAASVVAAGAVVKLSPAERLQSKARARRQSGSAGKPGAAGESRAR